MRHCLILTGGRLNLQFAREYCRTLSYDTVYAVDRGLEYAKQLGLVPDYIVGDFDTVDAGVLAAYEKQIQCGELASVFERHPVKKDATDTELALQKAMEEGAEQITLLAATGSRMDHVLANLGLLLQTARRGISCFMVDETNRIQLLCAEHRSCQISRAGQHGRYVSVLPFAGSVCGLTMEGVLYPLKEFDLEPGSSLTVSNEIVEELAVISIRQGQLLVIESADRWNVDVAKR
ncbi:MAG: thiamine diphosphokinase [Lachnospiraceae bacterium]|nr:thiamine diphosphokinase [Lachnospiraceae bacterium]